MDEQMSIPLEQHTHVVYLSGQYSSAYLAQQIEIKRKKENWQVAYVFIDSNEKRDATTLQFIRDLSDNLGIHVHTLPQGDSIQYCNEQWGEGQYTIWLGNRYDEPAKVRLFNLQNKTNTTKHDTNLTIRHLSEIDEIDEEGVMSWAEQLPFYPAASGEFCKPPLKQKHMVHVVSFSGGRTSAYLVHCMEQKRIYHGWDVRYIYMDTGAEHDNTYQFIRDIVNTWGIDLTIIRAKISPEMGVGTTYREIPLSELKQDLVPWYDMLKKYGEPTINGPRCTSRMKTDPHDKYCDEHFGRGNYYTWIGMRADEPRRIKNFDGIVDIFNFSGKSIRPIRYLAELSEFGKSDILAWWKQQPFDLALEEHLGNCVFCIKKTAAKLALAAKEEPEMAARFHKAISHKDTRRLPKAKHIPGEIYRGHLSMSKIIVLSRVMEDDEAALAVAEEATDEDSMCSESCEVFGSPAYDEDEG